MSPEAVAALGAFFTGLGSFLSAIWAMRSQRKKSEDECQTRIDAAYRRWQEAIREGLALEKRREDEERRKDEDEEDERWSHLP